MAEQTLQEKYDALVGHHKGVVDSLTMLQNKLDIALQQNADDKARYDKAVAELREQVVAMAKQYQENREELIVQHERALEEQAANLAAQHAQAVTKLKAEVLVPAQRDLHARQMADLAAKHESELAALTK